MPFSKRHKVPLVLHSEKGTLGFIPLDQEVPDTKAILSAKSFLKRVPKSQVVILVNAESAFALSDRLLVLPYFSVFL